MKKINNQVWYFSSCDSDIYFRVFQMDTKACRNLRVKTSKITLVGGIAKLNLILY